MWDIPMYDGETQRGVVHARQQGLRTTFQADCAKWGEGVYKVWLKGEQNELLLGTLMPEGEQVRLERVISNAMLREKGLEPCSRAEVRGEGQEEVDVAPRFGNQGEEGSSECREWMPMGSLDVSGWEPELARGIRELNRGRWRRRPEGIVLACPWNVGQKMPCMPLFCFASWSSGKGGVLT